MKNQPRIRLARKVWALVDKDSKRFKCKPYDLVNEILWCALREGDISKHWTSK